MAQNVKHMPKVTTTSTQATDRTVIGDGGSTRLPHTMSADEVIQEFNSNRVTGLKLDEVKGLQERFGPNVITPPKKPSRLKILGAQIMNAMTLVLIASMAVSFGTKGWIEAAVIAALVILNVTVGYTQEWKAEKTVAALASVGAPVAIVLRGGKEVQVNVEEVVPGDIILLSPGTIVPADGRVIQVADLEMDEALLTGESLPSSKSIEMVGKGDAPLGDRFNMVYAGSPVSKGRAKAVVVQTGMETELGKIAAAIERKVVGKETGWRAKWYKVQVALGVKGTTPLQEKLNKIAYLLLGAALLLALIVVASTAFTNIDDSIATYAVATAVSILPASLIAVVSVTLSSACRELAKRNALVRRMDAIEGLAMVTDINSDKTGTLTLGKMAAKMIWVPVTEKEDAKSSAPPAKLPGQTYEVETGSEPYYPRGHVAAVSEDHRVDVMDEKHQNDDIDAADLVSSSNMPSNLENFALCASLCNMASIHHNEDGSWQANGDATEIALQVFAHKLDRGKPHMTAADNRSGHYELIAEHPFDSSIKRMSTIWRPIQVAGAEQSLVYMKGAVERVLDGCDYVGMDRTVELTVAIKEDILLRMEHLASQGLRVLALSGRYSQRSVEELKDLKRGEVETGLGFLGLAGIIDPPRPESRSAVMQAAQAGIVTHMLTGDHPSTALAISKAVGIIGNNYSPSSVMTGPQLDALTEDEIDLLPELPLVIARCSPETKVRMVEAQHRRKLHGRARFCIMTGDGVNDSPALKRADVGVAMGLNGSDVAKSVSDIVLADDNFSSIISAIRKGRGTFSNLGKFLLYLLSGNLAEVIVLCIGLAFKNEEGVSVYPLSPVAALWINTIAAGPPALALGLEPTAADTMMRSPYDYRTIFTFWWYMDLIVYSVIMGAIALANFVIVVYAYGNGDLGINCNTGLTDSSCNLMFRARGTTFATLTLVLMLHSLQCKHLELGLFQVNLLDNRLLLWSAAALSLTVFPIIYIPRISDYAFQVLGLTWEWGIVFGMLLVYLGSTELYKFMKRRLIARKARAEGTAAGEKGIPMPWTMSVREV